MTKIADIIKGVGEAVFDAVRPSGLKSEATVCIVCATCCEINCLPWDTKPGTGTKKQRKNKGRKTFEEILGNFIQGSPLPRWMVQRKEKKKL